MIPKGPGIAHPCPVLEPCGRPCLWPGIAGVNDFDTGQARVPPVPGPLRARDDDEVPKGEVPKGQSLAVRVRQVVASCRTMGCCVVRPAPAVLPGHRRTQAVVAGARDFGVNEGGRCRRGRRREGGAKSGAAGHHEVRDEGSQKAKAGRDGEQEAQRDVSWVRQAPFRVSWPMPMQAKAAGRYEVIHAAGGNESKTAAAATSAIAVDTGATAPLHPCVGSLSDLLAVTGDESAVGMRQRPVGRRASC